MSGFTRDVTDPPGLPFPSLDEQAERRTASERLAGDPRSIAGFRILGRLSESGTSVVFLAEHGRMGRAELKLVHVAGAQETASREAFRREVDAARAGGGPTVPRLLAADPEAEVPWLATTMTAAPPATGTTPPSIDPTSPTAPVAPPSPPPVPSGPQPTTPSAERIGPGARRPRLALVYGLGGNAVVALVPVALLIAYLGLVDTFRDRVESVLAFAFEADTLGYNGPRTLDNVEQLTPWIPRVLVAFSVVTLVGATVRRLQLDPVVTRVYAACSAVVEAAVGAALVVPVGFVALIHDAVLITGPQGSFPGLATFGDPETTSPAPWLVLLIASVIVAFLGCAIVLGSLYRLGAVAFGGRITAHDAAVPEEGSRVGRSAAALT